jgi:16S rRNA processing protein RimM
MSKRILLGKIATAHGVRGLVKVMVFAEDPASLEKYGPLFKKGSGDETITLKMKNSLGSKGGKFWLAETEGVSDRTEAEKLRGTELWIDREKLPAAGDNEYYIEDLIGLSVRDSKGKAIGTIAGLQNFGAGNLLDIRPNDGESFYLPFTKENIIKVDIPGKTVTIEMPEGIIG